MAQAVVLRHQVRLHRGLGAITGLCAWGALVYYAYADYSLLARIYILNFGLGEQSVASSWRLWRVRPRDGWERALW